METETNTGKSKIKSKSTAGGITKSSAYKSATEKQIPNKPPTPGRDFKHTQRHMSDENLEFENKTKYRKSHGSRRGAY